MTKTFFTRVCALLLLASPIGQAAPTALQRSLFQQTHADLQTGKVDGFVALPADMRQYPLYPWLEYEYLKQVFDAVPDTQIADFALRNPGTLMSDDIYARLGKRLASQQAWQKLLDWIPADLDDTDTQCYRTQALAAMGQKDTALQTGKQAWMGISKGISEACAPVTDLLRRHTALSMDDYLARIRIAIDKNQSTLASQLAGDLPPELREAVESWIKTRQDPQANLPNLLKQTDSALLREAFTDGLTRIARKEPQTAENLWQSARQTFKFTPAETGKVESVLGMNQALRHEPAAIARLAAIPAEHRTQDGNLWLARMAARHNDWNNVLQASQLLRFDNERDAANWQYWQARALEQTGKTTEATSIYSKLAATASFYGFLSADRLGQSYSSLQTAPLDRTQRMTGLQKVAALQRAAEWFSIGNREQGRKEWFRALKLMDKAGMLAAAELALHSGEPNLAIWTISRAKEWDEVHLRFPLVHTDLVQEQARQQGIQPAWILGVMRRESAFDAQAESGAKALGLMQLIPPTAKTVGSKLGLTIRGKEDILQPATNVQLGSAYLSEMLGTFKGNYAQASAAYNAGPGRPLQWAPAVQINADQWVESIPFTETREYVQAVMAYTTIYDYKLTEGKGSRLSGRLPPITPNAPTTTSE